MIVDTSALIAILLDEPDRDDFFAVLETEGNISMSAATFLEASIVVDSLGHGDTSQSLDDLIEELDIIVVPVTINQSKIARRAYRQYGKGRLSPAKLNFGDCFSYSLAIDMNEPLLFKGDDFNHTDVRVALPPAH